MKKSSYFKGALTVSAGALVSKALGALYRIPLTALLGDAGMGVYQMVFPLYCMLLTVSSGGIPTGIARIISSNQCPFVERYALRVFACAGLLGATAMFAAAAPLAAAQGEPAVALCCKVMCPSVLFVSVISVVRGYFQGRGNMLPTAVTEVSEQLLKVVAGLILCYVYRHDATHAVIAAVFAVTFAEALSAVYAFALYSSSPKPRSPLFHASKNCYKLILEYTLPLTLTAIALPACQLAESIVVVGVLREHITGATALWGIFSGCAVTLVNLPVSLTYGLAAAGVPRISPVAQSGDNEGAKRLALNSVVSTFAVSAPCAVALAAFAPMVCGMLFGSLSPSSRDLLVTLVRVMSVNAVSLSLVQTSSACLASLGMPLVSTFSQWLSGGLRILLSWLLTAFTPLSIVGAAVSANVCYLVAVLINIWYIIRCKNDGRRNSARTVFGRGARSVLR